MTDAKRPLLAVLFDADNIPAKQAKPILDEIATHGEPVLRRVYGDWSTGRIKAWEDPVRELGMTGHQLSANTTGKNASDIGMVIDAMDMLHSRRFDGFALVSSDSDFTALANRLREEGLIVLGIGENKTPGSLRNACTRFILIENIAQDKEAATDQPRKSKHPVSEAAKIIRRALSKSEAPDGWMGLGQLGQIILSENRDFDVRTYGYRKLSDLVEETGKVETRKENGHIYARVMA